METLLSSFALVAASEMGDKTQLLAFSLSARFKKPLPVLMGIFLATILNHSGASFLGRYASGFLSQHLLKFVLSGTFFVFALWTLKPDKFEENSKAPRMGAFLTAFVLFFLAEMGDKTQLATVALGARFSSVAIVTVGTTLGMMVSDGLAVFVGHQMSEKLPMHWIRRAAAALFFIFGIFILL